MLSNNGFLNDGPRKLSSEFSDLALVFQPLLPYGGLLASETLIVAPATAPFENVAELVALAR